ncbi:putative DEAD helicases superfamily protein [Taphrina deformans PYCC 5710]|uniref:DEAD helicases superfamily protein n=1 Tax=Taphrina deformans (strain PYCC 5710 / ATCC 11124 / CBS 356.35 / IMI 108563 / JCM 9778 / NBRC 8474) TaxID=1097556 RepID=R4XCH9_TAPDE|nr:putative DEAD helicases superfamily protein [Taphrina deformans PYCC 5710]|eukprot:CCG83306.1 putative DEAD helicases superfamily protein [Taphrina deformans PYCC 5710]
MKRSGALQDVEALKTVYDDLVKQGLAQSAVARLNDSRLLEECIWPQYSQNTDVSISSLVCVLLDELRSRGRSGLALLATDAESDDPRIAKLVGDILTISLDAKQLYKVRCVCLSTLIDTLFYLDIPLVQQAVQPLVSIMTWRHLLPSYREELFRVTPVFKKRFRAKTKALDSTTNGLKTRTLSDASYIHSLVADLFVQLYTLRSDVETLQYCSRVIELLCVVLSQLPTRRYIFYLLKDCQILTRIRLSSRYKQKESPSLLELKAHVQVLDYFMNIPYSNVEGRKLSSKEIQEQSVRDISALQRLAFSDFKDSLILLALSNYATITDRVEMASHLAELSLTELKDLCTKLNIRTGDGHKNNASQIDDTQFLREALVDRYAKRTSISEQIVSSSPLPTEAELFSPIFNTLAASTDHFPMAKLTLQYLSVEDFLFRSQRLLHFATFQSIRIDIVTTLSRLSPQITYPSREIKYNGSSNNALMIEPPAILEVTSPHISRAGYPGSVRAEILIDLDDLGPEVRKGWNGLVKGDILYFLSLTASDATSTSTPAITDPDFATKIGLQHVRCAVLESILSGDGKPLHLSVRDSLHEAQQSAKRKLRVLFDPVAFQADKDNGKLEAVYENLNVLLKRKASKNDFLHIFDGIQNAAAKTNNSIPPWLVESLLGFGSPSEEEAVSCINLHDTFVDRVHAAQILETDPQSTAPDTNEHEAQYAKKTNSELQAMLAKRDLPTKGKKAELVARLLEQEASMETRTPIPATSDESFSITLHSDTTISRKRKRHELVFQDYKLSIRSSSPSGPYVENRVKHNDTRFTAEQIRAICAGTTSGLTLVDGPAGSGKTAIAAQTLSNIYLSEPEHRSIVVCKNEKCMKRLVDSLEGTQVESCHIFKYSAIDDEDFTGIAGVLRERTKLLREVSHLATSLGVPGDHGSSCESAAYFFDTIARRSVQMWLKDASLNTLDKFFDSTRLDDGLSMEQRKLASLTYIDNIFTRLAEIRPMELLKGQKSRRMFMLTSLAKIIVTTAEHVAKVQTEIAEAQITCQTILIIQANAISELGAFFPLSTMHNPGAVNRLLLLGDSQQITPRSVALEALKVSCRMEQSLFARLQRSGVSAIVLREQTRCREKIFEIIKHRYTSLNTLPDTTIDEYSKANAGLSHTCQFIDVSDYKGRGEFSPRAGSWQNLGEAEYVVALYQYLRLLNYPSQKITLLTPFESQKALIQDVLDSRCRNPIFGLPVVATVEEYQGQQNDYVLVSLVRSKVGLELQDLGMITTALSRARLGLYVFGRRAGMPAVLEPFLAPLDIVSEGKLELVTGEMYPTDKLERDDERNISSMAGVEHLGQYVYQMTQRRLEAVADK